MSFQDFQKSKRHSIDIEADIGAPEMRHCTGLIYTASDGSEWWIEDAGFECGQYFTMMYNEDYCSDDLEAVERWLYDHYG